MCLSVQGRVPSMGGLVVHVVSPNLGALCTYIEHSFLMKGRQSSMVGLQSSLFEDL